MSLLTAFNDKLIININEYDKKTHHNISCIFCESKLIGKKGNILAHHFSHKNKSDCPSYNAEPMTKCHKYIQDLFGKYGAKVEQQFINPKTGKKHIADIICRNDYDMCREETYLEMHIKNYNHLYECERGNKVILTEEGKLIFSDLTKPITLEVQCSYINKEQIKSREDTYPNLFWLFNADDRITKQKTRKVFEIITHMSISDHKSVESIVKKLEKDSKFMKRMAKIKRLKFEKHWIICKTSLGYWFNTTKPSFIINKGQIYQIQKYLGKGYFMVSDYYSDDNIFKLCMCCIYGYNRKLWYGLEEELRLVSFPEKRSKIDFNKKYYDGEFISLSEFKEAMIKEDKINTFWECIKRSNLRISKDYEYIMKKFNNDPDILNEISRVRCMEQALNQ